MPKIVILTGPDKSGKTTLTSSLLKEYPWFSTYKSLKPASLDIANKTTSEFLEKQLSTVNPIICDRFHYPEELIYSSLNRAEDLPDDIKKWYKLFVIPTLQKLDTKIIYCTASTDILKQRFIESKETDIQIEWFESLQAKYKEFVKHAQFAVLTLDSGFLTKEEMLYKSINFLEKGIC